MIRTSASERSGLSESLKSDPSGVQSVDTVPRTAMLWDVIVASGLSICANRSGKRLELPVTGTLSQWSRYRLVPHGSPGAAVYNFVFGKGSARTMRCLEHPFFKGEGKLTIFAGHRAKLGCTVTEVIAPIRHRKGISSRRCPVYDPAYCRKAKTRQWAAACVFVFRTRSADLPEFVGSPVRVSPCSVESPQLSTVTLIRPTRSRKPLHDLLCNTELCSGGVPGKCLCRIVGYSPFGWLLARRFFAVWQWSMRFYKLVVYTSLGAFVARVRCRVDPLLYCLTGGRLTSAGPQVIPQLVLTTVGREWEATSGAVGLLEERVLLCRQNFGGKSRLVLQSLDCLELRFRWVIRWSEYWPHVFQMQNAMHFGRI